MFTISIGLVLSVSLETINLKIFDRLFFTFKVDLYKVMVLVIHFTYFNKD